MSESETSERRERRGHRTSVDMELDRDASANAPASATVTTRIFSYCRRSNEKGRSRDLTEILRTKREQLSTLAARPLGRSGFVD